jgi:hypothetical protein
MKTIKLNFIFLIIIFSCLSFTKNKKYLLSVNEKSIIYSGHECLIPVQLKNISKDTLYHYEMSCSWQEHYKTSINDLEITINECDKNHPRKMQLNPQSSQFVYLKIERKLIKFPNKKIKIGFNILESNSNEENKYEKLKLINSNNFIWSNSFKLDKNR